MAKAQEIQKKLLEAYESGESKNASDDEIDEVEKRIAVLSDGKKTLKKQIKDFEKEFTEKTGAEPTNMDKECKKEMYSSYQDYSIAVKQGTALLKLMYKV